MPRARVLSAVTSARIKGLPQAFDTLLALGVFVAVADTFYRDKQIAEIRKKLAPALCEGKLLTPAHVRDILGTSRKYVVPLLEWLDAVGFTVRKAGGRCSGLIVKRRAE